MPKGKQVSIKSVEGIPYYVEGETDGGELTISGPTREGRIRFVFDDGSSEPVEIDLDELIEALIYVDESGAFARKVLYTPGT